MNKQQIIQQAQQVAKEEVKNTFESVKKQISAEEGAQQQFPESLQPEVNAEEIKQQEQVKMEELRKKLDDEISKARQLRQQANQQYSQSIEEQLKPENTQQNDQVVETPHSVQKGPRLPFGAQSKKGTKEMGKMKG